MARRKKHRRTHRRRRHGMGAIGGGMTTTLGIVGGAVIAKVLGNYFKDKASNTVIAAGQIGAGLILPMVVKNKIMQSIGTGMIVNGSVTALQSFGVISAINGMVGADEITYEYDSSMSGSDTIPSISGYQDEGVMTGGADLQFLSGDFDSESDGMDY